MTEISDLSNNTDLKDNAYQTTLQQYMEFFATINKITNLSIPRQQTMDQGYKRGGKQKHINSVSSSRSERSFLWKCLFYCVILDISIIFRVMINEIDESIQNVLS